MLVSADIYVPAAYFARNRHLPGDKRIIPYVLPLSLIGGSISIYHYAEQKIPALSKVLPCTIGVPCNTDYLNYFGFITIPPLALIAFALITILLWTGRKEDAGE